MGRMALEINVHSEKLLKGQGNFSRSGPVTHL